MRSSNYFYIVYYFCIVTSVGSKTISILCDPVITRVTTWLESDSTCVFRMIWFDSDSTSKKYEMTCDSESLFKSSTILLRKAFLISQPDHASNTIQFNLSLWSGSVHQKRHPRQNSFVMSVTARPLMALWYQIYIFRLSHTSWGPSHWNNFVSHQSESILGYVQDRK